MLVSVARRLVLFHFQTNTDTDEAKRIFLRTRIYAPFFPFSISHLIGSPKRFNWLPVEPLIRHDERPSSHLELHFSRDVIRWLPQTPLFVIEKEAKLAYRSLTKAGFLLHRPSSIWIFLFCIILLVSFLFVKWLFFKTTSTDMSELELDSILVVPFSFWKRNASSLVKKNIKIGSYLGCWAAVCVSTLKIYSVVGHVFRFGLIRRRVSSRKIQKPRMDDSRGANSRVISQDGRGDAAMTCRLLPFLVASRLLFFLSTAENQVTVTTTLYYRHLGPLAVAEIYLEKETGKNKVRKKIYI